MGNNRITDIIFFLPASAEFLHCSLGNTPINRTHRHSVYLQPPSISLPWMKRNERLHLLAAMPDPETAQMLNMLSVSKAAAVINLYPDEISGIPADWRRILQDVFDHSEQAFWLSTRPFSMEESGPMNVDRLGIVLFTRKPPEWIEDICEAAWMLKKQTHVLLVHTDWNSAWEKRVQRWSTMYQAQTFRLHPVETTTQALRQSDRCPLPTIGLADFLKACKRFIVV